jgi:CheY-like chemotaxis protein
MRQSEVKMSPEPRILYVEDDCYRQRSEDDNKDPFLEELEAEGYEVVVARSGEEAWELLTKQCFHCVVLDIMLPHKNEDSPYPSDLPCHRTGIFVLEKIRGEAFSPVNQANTPVVVASAIADLKDVTIIKQQLKPEGYLVKPFFPPALVQEVRRVMKSVECERPEDGR